MMFPYLDCIRTKEVKGVVKTEPRSLVPIMLVVLVLVLVHALVASERLTG